MHPDEAIVAGRLLRKTVFPPVVNRGQYRRTSRNVAWFRGALLQREPLKQPMERMGLALLLVLLAGEALSLRAQTSLPSTPTVRPLGKLTPSSWAITDPSLIAVTSDFTFVGREVAFEDVQVERVGPYGFWIATPDHREETFVIPAEGRLIAVRAGDSVSIHGDVRQMSTALRQRLFLGYAWNEHIYVHAFTVRPTGLWRYDSCP